MSEQRIDTGAEAATSTDADPGEGMGTAHPPTATAGQGTRTAGGDADLPQPTVDQPGTGAGGDTADTEGASALQDAHQTAAEQQRREPDLSGREPAGDDAARPSPAPGAAESSTEGSAGGAGRPAHAETGEVSAEPSPERRAEDPGSVATEFGDRADSAPEDDIARPTM